MDIVIFMSLYVYFIGVLFSWNIIEDLVQVVEGS